MNHLSEEINSDIINRTCTFSLACKGITPTRIEIIWDWSFLSCRMLRIIKRGVVEVKWERILLGNDFHYLSLNWSTSQYTNHIAWVSYEYIIYRCSSRRSVRVASRSQSQQKAPPRVRTTKDRATCQDRDITNCINSLWTNNTDIGNGYLLTLRTDFTQILFHFAHQSLSVWIYPSPYNLDETVYVSQWNYISMKLNQSAWFFFFLHTSARFWWYRLLDISVITLLHVCCGLFFLHRFYFIVCLDPTRFHVILQSSHEGDCRYKTKRREGREIMRK